MQEVNSEQTLEPAGFWRRVAASLADSIIFFFLEFIIISLIMIFTEWDGAASLRSRVKFSIDTSPLSNHDISMIDIVIVIFTITQGCYIAAFESSRLQATAGGYLVGIKILNKDGSSIGFFKSFFRIIGMQAIVFLASAIGIFAGILASFALNPDISESDISWIANKLTITLIIMLITINIGCFIAKKRFLHDIIFRTRMVRR
ncbi:RDD family protein [Candidatus Tisiphia endosymbiont of Nemotelus uliginosus]|uniref:RDD family protein n=1 Tax=Candidatus Tisiphia endosymbiont of Nemotelus uliginosus TaxID=3077926 RepID=UPI0035C8BF62